MEYREFKIFMEQLAKKSETLISAYFSNHKLNVEFKMDESPVTQADREAEILMRDMIKKKYPSHGVIGEEFGRENDTAEFVWVLDPIDGTKSFVCGCPLFGTLICLLHKGQPILGAINLPILKQFCIGDGEITMVNGKPVKVRKLNDLSKAILLATDIENIAAYQSKEGFENLIKQTYLFRTWGDCYGYFLVASGQADIMMDPVMKSWDLLALIPVIKGAGGMISDWQGENPVTAKSSVAANKVLHPQILEILNT